MLSVVLIAWAEVHKILDLKSLENSLFSSILGAAIIKGVGYKEFQMLGRKPVNERLIR